ncbi:MAG: DUF2997 domain-containing protein [Cyanobacteria bacterium M_surface_10_m2_179]|nr:DUF2997 domain-containing protein [Cyanobacteria bacterium M_surface_10_m2_179]
MAQHTIRFRIRPDGRVEELVEGISGSGCEQLTERIEAKLGSVQQRQSTSEAYQSSNAAVTPEQTLSSPVS